jgi:hypothetical protein
MGHTTTYLPLPRRCTDCGTNDLTALIETSGSQICRGCLRETTQVPKVRQPATPWLDAHIARVEAREAKT